MPTKVDSFFELYVDDDRYSVPTLRLFVATDEIQARDLAAELFMESAHHLGVEVRRGDRRIGALGTFAVHR
jgi:hypothetical protein